MGRLISNDDAVSSAVVSPYQFSWRGVGFSLRNDIVPQFGRIIGFSKFIMSVEPIYKMIHTQKQFAKFNRYLFVQIMMFKGPNLQNCKFAEEHYRMNQWCVQSRGIPCLAGRSCQGKWNYLLPTQDSFKRLLVHAGSKDHQQTYRHVGCIQLCILGHLRDLRMSHDQTRDSGNMQVGTSIN